MDWTDGYRADLDYTAGYYGELAPGRIDFTLLLAGYAAPPRGPLRYLELGYGQGVTAAIHAAARPGRYWGADFNPSHAAHAQVWAARLDAELWDDSFAELARRDAIPEVDYVTLHGIWSWVSPAVQQSIIDVIRARLRVGGAVYISYNALPGWAAMLPMQHLMAAHAAQLGAAADPLARVDGALAYLQRLVAADARFFTANPLAVTRLEGFTTQNRRYLAHEFFNQTWTPLFFSQVAERLADAKLAFACSGSALEHIDAFQLTPGQRDLLAELTSSDLRQTVRDFFQNTQFRRDLFTRVLRLPAITRVDRLLATRFAALIEPADMDYTIRTALGEIGLKREIYAPILEALATAAEPMTLRELAALPALAAWELPALIEAIATLVGSARVHPAQPPDTIAQAAPACARLNAELLDRARTSGDISYLASPVIGGGVGVSRFEQLFLGARSVGGTEPEGWAHHAWLELARQGQHVIKDGVALTSAEDNLAELTTRATAFAERRLPLLRRLGVTT